MERFCFVVVLAFLLSPVVGHSQTRILVSCRSEKGGEKLSGLVERCAAFALEQAGCLPVGPAPVGESPAPGPAASWTLQADASYLNGDYRLELSFLAPDGLCLSSTVLSGRLSLDFDVQLLDAVARLIHDSGVDLTRANPQDEASEPPGPGPMPAAKARQDVADLLSVMVAEAPVPSTAAPPGPGALPVPDGEALASSAATPAEPAVLPALPLPGEAEGAAVILPAAGKPAGILFLDADSGPVFVIGQASESFRYGIDVSLRVGARLGTGILRIDAALRTGYARLSPTGLVDGALHLITLGPEIGLVLPEASPVRFRCRIGCGPLYVAAEAEGLEVVGKILPFGSAGLGMDFLPSPKFSIGLELQMMVVFERSEPLIALVPVLGLGLRF